MAAFEGPLITIGVPAHNAGRYIRGAVDSALAQTHENVEVVVVDDASDDDTAAIIEEIAQADGRVKLVKLASNSQPFEARRACVENASGEYVMYLDADDELEPDVCSLCVEELRRDPVDILHFSAVPEYVHATPSPEVVAADKRYLEPEGGSARGADIVHRVFVDRKGPWAMWAKLYSASVLRAAYAALPCSRLLIAEDACSFFAVAHYAATYRAVPTLCGYRYRIDAGATGEGRLGEDALKTLSKLCCARLSMDVLKDFIEANDAWGLYQRDYDLLRAQLVDDAVGCFVTRVLDERKGDAFGVLDEAWEPEELEDAFKRRGDGSWEAFSGQTHVSGGVIRLFRRKASSARSLFHRR